jgi:hypothetical protein
VYDLIFFFVLLIKKIFIFVLTSKFGVDDVNVCGHYSLFFFF